MRNFRKIAGVVLFISIILLVNQILFMALKPYNYFRNDIHNIETHKYDDVFVGSSHGKAAIHPEKVDKVTGRKSVNMCLGGQYPIDSYYTVREMCRKNKPKRVVYELDPGYWVTKASLGPDYATLYEELPWSEVKLEYFRHKMLEIDFRATVFPWYVYRQGYGDAVTRLKGRTSMEYLDYEDSFYDNPLQSYGKSGAVSIHRTDKSKTEDNLVLWNENKLEEQSVKYFNKLVELCRKEEIELIIVTTPIPVETIDKYSEQYEKANKFFGNLMKKKKIPYYNFNEIKIKNFDYTLNGFTDYEGHMYEDQGEIFSRELGKYLQ